MDKIKRVLDELKIIRRTVLLWAMCINTWSFYYVFYDYMPKCEEPSAVIIGAILAPSTGLLTFVSMFYSNSRTAENTRIINGN